MVVRKKFNFEGLIISSLLVVAVIPAIFYYSQSFDRLKRSEEESKSNQTSYRNVKKYPFDLSHLHSDEFDRIDCFLEAQSPFEIFSEYQCKTIKKCLYKESEYDRVPWCYFDRQNLGYKLKGPGPSPNSYLLEGDPKKSPYLGTIKNLLLKTTYLGNNIIRVKITDNTNERFEVPYPLNLPDEIADIKNTAGEFKIIESSNQLASFQITRRNGNDILFDTTNGAFVYNDQFLQISTDLNADSSIYGFGENNHENLKHDLNYRSWAMFGRDNGVGWGDYRNNYGYQPVYLIMEPSGKSHLVLLYNSNAMEYLFTPKPSLTMRTIGGILDLYFIVDDTPEKVLQHYHNLIGLPVLPPYWSLGFQLSKYSYDTLDKVKLVVQRNRDIKLLHDVQYLDIDYMNGFRILTIDKANYKGLREYQKELADFGVRLVLIIDPGLVMEKNNTIYVDGVKNDIYVRWPKEMTPYDIDSREDDAMISWCWPNAKLSFPDYMYENTHEWWIRTVKQFINDRENGTDLDGLWIDMNEPAAFDTNEMKPWNWGYPEYDQDRYPYYTLKCPPNKYDDPPYRTKAAFVYDDYNLIAKKARLSSKTLCMIGLHRKDGKEFYHYDVHNLYGHSQAIATYKAMLNAKPGLRPFVLTRSNYVGTGHYAVHWLGDNDSSWKHIRMSIIGLIEYNIFGIPMVGADICGYFSQVQEVEMCTRWLQVGAFYTFSRSHNANIDKDPASFNSKVLEESTRNALKMRYTILPYIYTLFYKAHIEGGSVIRPLFFEFAKNKETHKIQEQFLIGSSFLVSPVVYEGKREVRAYFPNETRWYDFRKGNIVEKYGWQTLAAPLDYIHLHIRGGIVMPIQEPEECLNTVCTRKKPIGLIIALDESNKASGELFWDDGVSLIDSVNPNYYFMKFNYENTKLNMKITTKGIIKDEFKLNFETFKIYGFIDYPKEVLVNGVKITNYSYDYTNNVLNLRGLGLPLFNDFEIEFKI